VLVEEFVNTQLFAGEMEHALRIRNCFTLETRKNVAGELRSSDVFLKEGQKPVRSRGGDDVVPVQLPPDQGVIDIAPRDTQQQLIFVRMVHLETAAVTMF
jgi:hypothetical protein